ncbi:VCBS repeat-containing protein [Myxococcota bacterium]|nr:VCBS repeat-containing protein [Myxococcota bacterium]
MARTRSTAIGLLAGLAIAGLLLATSARPAYSAPSNALAWKKIGRSGQQLGSSVGTAGDFNCDGISDLALGGPNSDYTAQGLSLDFLANWGWIEIHYGSRTLPAQPNAGVDWVTVDGAAFPGFGTDLAELGERLRMAAGDVNRDGCDDLITTTTPSGFGSYVQIHFGSASGPSTTTGWKRQFISAGPFSDDLRGSSIASGDVNGDGTADIIVGVPRTVSGGAVLVWLGSQFLANTPSGPADPDWVGTVTGQAAGLDLGASVASGDINGDGRDDIVAGAPGWDGFGPNSIDSGIVLAWLGSPTIDSGPDGTLANAAWSFEIGSPGARLGAAVAVAGDLDGDERADIVMGAPVYDNPATTGNREGTVVVVRGAAPSPPSNVPSWFHVGQTSDGRLGFSVASAGDVNGDGRADYLMGEPGFTAPGPRFGRALLTLGRPTAQWTINPVPDVVYSEASTFSFERPYGFAVASAGDWNDDGFSDIVIGAPDFGPDANGSTTGKNGHAFVYLGGGDTVASTPVDTRVVDQAGASLGLGVAFAGDINQDGFTDIVSGAPNYESSAGENGEGRIFVSYGGACGTPDCAAILEPIVSGDRELNQAGAQLGWSVSSAGDVNGDGYADVIAGAPGFDGTFFPCSPFPPPGNCLRSDSGTAVLYLGSANGLAFTAAWSADDVSQANARFGYAVANAGDVNGDGYADVLVSAPYFDGSAGADAGRVALYLGSATGLSATPSWRREGSQANARFGIDVAGAGDVDGDGFSDVLIGADGFGATGAAFLFFGRPTTPSFPQGLTSIPIRTFTGLQTGSSFGLTVATAGDLNRDGLADFVVGAPTTRAFAGLGPQTGAVHVYHGAPGGPSTVPSGTLAGSLPPLNGAHRFGNGVAGAGDVNGDGFGDLIVGDQWNAGPAGFAQGEAYLFHGAASGVSTTVARSFRDCTLAPCDFGRDVAGAGDVNGDGFSDVLIGAFGYTGSLASQGATFVHLGNEGRGLPLRPLQSRAQSGPPLALLGLTADAFSASLDLATPAGRGRVQLELEVESAGQEFDGRNLIRSVALDNVIHQRTALDFPGAFGGRYQWRARLRSASPLFGRSRWVSLPENAPRELDVRVVPEPGFAAALAAGLFGLTLLGHERRSLRKRAGGRRRTRQ